MADHFGLLVDFLGHEVLVVALVDHMRRGGRLDAPARSTVLPLLVADLDALVRQHRPVAVLEIADGSVNGASAMASEPRYISPSP